MKERITICGAGLVGSLLALFLKNKGFDVRVFEKRPDPRINSIDAGRSINLAISHRGLQALKAAIPNLDIQALTLAVSMYGRAIHDEAGVVTFQPYGESSQHINSIGRGELNQLLIEKAEIAGVEFLFSHSCVDYEVLNRQWIFNTSENVKVATANDEILIGADGAFSIIRKHLLAEINQQAQIDILDYGYKELEIKSEFAAALSNNEALHIWPRERFMLIALPNKDGSYTATLFMPMNGEISFDVLNNSDKILFFFKKYFSDACELIPDLITQFEVHPTSNLSTIHTSTWFNSHTLLIGDAAHALVPFYGQGMNAGFEDCRILSELISSKDELNWEDLFEEFFELRKKNTDAISDLALQNFVEMRDDVADAAFLLRKKIEKYLHEQLNERFIPQYTLVSFSDTPYAVAKNTGVLHSTILDEIMCLPNIQSRWPTVELQAEAIKIAETYL